MNYFKELLGDSYKEELTVDELAVLVKAKVQALEADVRTYKGTSEKNATDAAGWKQKYTDKLTDAEKEKARYDELEKENNELKTNSKIAEKTAQYVALGYDEVTAKETAKALVDGDFDKVIANQKTFNDKVKSDFDSKLLENTPTPPAGSKKPMSKEEFNKLSYGEMVKLQQDSPEIYAELSKN